MKIKFLPQGIEVDGTPEKTLLQIASENQIEIKSLCKGVPSCAECRVRIVEGEGVVTHPTKAELNLIGSSYYIDNRRLACQVRCFGPVTVDMSEQLNQEHLKHKKIRGFKSSKHAESTAVQDTLLLTEKPQVEEPPQPSRPQQQPSQQRQPQQQHHQQQGPRSGENRPNDNRGNESRGGGRHRPKGGAQAQSQVQAQSPGKSQTQSQGQGQNKNPNRNQGQNQNQKRNQNQNQQGRRPRPKV